SRTTANPPRLSRTDPVRPTSRPRVARSWPVAERDAIHHPPRRRQPVGRPGPLGSSGTPAMLTPHTTVRGEDTARGHRGKELGETTRPGPVKLAPGVPVGCGTGSGLHGGLLLGRGRLGALGALGVLGVLGD